MMEIKEMSITEFSKMLESQALQGEYYPIGLFCITEKDGSFTGVDNSSGDVWVENFITKDLCCRWLQGEFEMDELEFQE